MKKSFLSINFPKLLALLSPMVNMLCIINTRVAGVLPPVYSPFTSNFRLAQNKILPSQKKNL